MSIPNPPVEHVPDFNLWIVHEPELRAKCLLDKRLSSEWPRRSLSGASAAGSTRAIGSAREWFMFRDGGDHTRLRKIATEVFKRDRAPWHRAIVDDAIAKAFHGKSGVVDAPGTSSFRSPG